MNLRQVLNNSKIGMLDKLNFVKTRIKPENFFKVFNNNRILNQVISQNLFPSKLENIRVNEPFQFTNDFLTEFQWTATKVLLNTSKINEFVLLKEKFEISLLKNEYDVAKEILKKISINLGQSLWLVESEFHSAEEEIGSNENWQKLSDHLKIIQNPFYELCISASSKKVEKSVSFDSYLNQTQNDINTINANDLIKDFFVFNNFKLANYNYELPDLQGVIYISNLYSIIDQYNILLDVIIFNLNKNTVDIAVYKSFVEKLIEDGNKDIRVINIYNYLSSDFTIENELWKPTNDILESFYHGNFELSLQLSKDFILSYPLEFETYEIYVKSLINLKREFEHFGVKSLDIILYDLFNFLQFKKDNEKFARKLLKHALKYSNSILGFQIMDFVSNVDNNKIDSLKYSFYSNSYKLSIKKTEKNIQNNLQQFFSRNNYYNYKIIMNGIKKTDDKFKSNDAILQVNSQITHLYNNENYNGVIDSITSQIEICSSINYYKERFIFYLFNSYLKENRIEEALNLFGTLFFDEKTFYIKLNFKDLYYQTFKEDDKFKYVKNINSLVLSSLYQSEYNLYEILDEFLCLNDYDFEFLSEIDYLNVNVKIYVLSKICTINTIKYYFSRIRDAEEGRIKILHHLMEIDENEKKNYQEEIDEIKKKISVRNVIKEVNNGRLFVDIAKLKEKLIEKYDDDFNRLLRIVGEKKKLDLIGFNASKPRKWEATLKEKSQEDFDGYNEADFIAFKNIYHEVREQFLFSKEYGLDSNLSTRIRHGSLENQIRSVFDNLNLVTTKLSGEYIDSEYWSNQSLNNEILQVIQNQIKIFSKSLDDFTSNLKNNAVQISHERINNEHAKFNYYTNDEILYKFYSEHIEYLKNTDDIVDILLNDLSHFTKFNLCVEIYKYLTKEVYDNINSFVDYFLLNLPKTLPGNILLIEKINTSLTNLQLCLEDIAEWFVLETSSRSNLLMLEDIINASIELTKQLNNNLNIDFQIDMQFKEVSAYSSLIYVFNILFTNAIIHSEIENDFNIEVKVNLLEETYIKIDIVNNHKISNPTDKLTNLDLVKKTWNDFQKIERSNIEGESGFHKIKRIMIYEAKCITDKFDFEFAEDSMTISLYLIYKKPEYNEDINN